MNPENPDYELFWRAAQAARNPQDAPEAEYLMPYENTALTDENRGFLGQTRVLKVCVATLCFSAMVQGWAQTGGNGKISQATTEASFARWPYHKNSR